MPGLYVGATKAKDVYVGATKAKAVYVGTTKVWPSSLFEDDFDRTAIGADWTTSGTAPRITDAGDGYAYPAQAAEGSMYTAVTTHPADVDVTVTVQSVPDAVQATSIVCSATGAVNGTTLATWCSVEFNRTQAKFVTRNNGTFDIPAAVTIPTINAGDVLTFRRKGSTLSLIRGGTVLASRTATLPGGTGRVGLTFRGYYSWPTWYLSPYISRIEVQPAP